VTTGQLRPVVTANRLRKVGILQPCVKFAGRGEPDRRAGSIGKA
jgi:hypothetical protein